MNSLDPKNPEELASVFWLFLDEISSYYEAESIQNFRSWHTEDELREKIDDSKRFFRIVRDEKWEIIAYFESKSHSDAQIEWVQVIQWFFVKPQYRKSGILKDLFKKFETWCRENGYNSIWSYTALRNDVWFQVHTILFDERDIVNVWFWDVHWFRKKLQ
jgi:GNAT superfamily N-acetyltransferase